MRRLLLLRHAKAERPKSNMNDRDRALIKRGRSDAAIIGAYIASHALIPDHVALSPAARTRETWKFAATAFRSPPAAIVVEKLYDATEHTIFAVIKAAPAAAHTLLMIGHNPGLHEVALMLVACGDVEAHGRLRDKLPTTGLVVVDFAFDDWRKLQPRCGRLDRFVTPKSLEAAAK